LRMPPYIYLSLLQNQIAMIDRVGHKAKSSLKHTGGDPVTNKGKSNFPD